VDVQAARIPLLALRAWMKRGSHASPKRERGNPVSRRARPSWPPRLGGPPPAGADPALRACGTGRAGGPHSLACAAGLDEEGFPCKPEARARESVLPTHKGRSNPEINARDEHLPCRTLRGLSSFLHERLPELLRAGHRVVIGAVDYPERCDAGPKRLEEFFCVAHRHDFVV
jgi:hypothetical protein